MEVRALRSYWGLFLPYTTHYRHYAAGDEGVGRLARRFAVSIRAGGRGGEPTEQGVDLWVFFAGGGGEEITAAIAPTEMRK